MEDRVVSKVMWRLVPFMMVLYIFNYLDRINISVAKLRMNPDLGMSEDGYGTGTALFFIGYFFLEVPSNIMLERLGARIWITRIMVSWGLVSTAFMFVGGQTSFNVMRLLLGAAEAGFFPGMVLFLTYWIPAKQRARAGAIFMTSIAMAGVIGQPLSSWVMESFDGTWGLKGWQWIFVAEGIPTILLGCSVYFLFTDKPSKAEWLSAEERDWLTKKIDDEQSVTRTGHGHHSFFAGMSNPHVWALSAVYMSLMFGFYGINYWTPTIIKETYMREYASGLDAAALKAVNVHVGFMSAIPFIAAIVGMVIIGFVADRTGKRRNVLVCSAITGVVGLVAAAYTQTTVTTIAALSLAAVGIFGCLSPFWTLPSEFLTGTAAAAGIAFINSWGNLGGGFIGNKTMGWLKDFYTGKVERPYMYGLLIDAAVLVAGIAVVLLVRTKPRKTDLEPTHA